MKLSKKMWVILASSVGGVAVVATTTVGIVSNLPKNVFAKSVVGFFEDAVEREEIAPIYNMLQKGSLEASLSKVKYEGIDLMEDMSFAGKVYFSDKGLAVKDVQVAMDGLEIEGEAYLTSDLVYVQEKHLLDGSYGIKKKDFEKDLDDSIFAYDSESAYAIPDENIYNALIDTVNCIDEDMAKDLEKVSKKYIKKFWKIVSKHADFDKSSSVEKLAGKRTAVRSITMTIDGRAMANIAEDMYDFMESDKALVKFLKEYQDAFSLMYCQVDEDSDAPTNIVEEYENWLEEFEDQVDMLADAADEVDDEGAVVIELATPKLSSKLLKLSVGVEYSDYTMEMLTIDCGKEGIKDTDYISLESSGIKMVYEIETNTKREYEASLEVGGAEVLEVSVDRAKDEYELKVGETKYKGEISTKSKVTTITVDKIIEKNYSGSTTTNLDLKIVIDQKDKMPSAPKNFDTLADIKEEDIEKWNETFGGVEDDSASYDGWCDRCDDEYAYRYEGNKEYCSDCYEYIMGYDGYCDICDKKGVYDIIDGKEMCFDCWWEW